MPGFPRDRRQFFSPADCQYVTGTWSDAIVSNIASKNKTAAAETPTVIISITPPRRTRPGSLIRIVRVKVYYEIATLAGTAVTFRVRLVTLAPDGTAISSAAVTFTKDLTDAQAYALGHRCVTITITDGKLIADGQTLHVEFDLTCAATTVLKFKGALVEYTEPPAY
jgi:hypothetical protein